MTIELAEGLKEYGAKLQVNLYSIGGDEENEQVSSMAHQLIKNKLADFIGSDAHNLSHRPPEVEYALWRLPLEATYEYAKKITSENPSRLVDTNCQ